MNTTPYSEAQAAAAVKAFKQNVFSHPAAGRIFNELTSALSATSSPQTIILTGPTGVGKSTLARKAVNRLIKQYQAQLNTEPDFVPVVMLDAVPPTGTAFSWKDFWIRLLTGENEPLVDRKLAIGGQRSLLPELVPSCGQLDGTGADALRRSAEQFLKHRKTKLLIIDEAQHMLLVGSRERLECQFECLKSLTLQTGVTILLTGTYKLLDILDLSGQLTRRSQVINFPRYDSRKQEDREEFRKILAFLEEKLSIHVQTRLLDAAEYFYLKTAGCMGILKDWLCRCLETALREGAPVIDKEFAARFALKNRGLVTIIEEARAGEAKLADVSDGELLKLLEQRVEAAPKMPRLPNLPRPPFPRPTVTRNTVGRMLI